jgi:hypothetical protein
MINWTEEDVKFVCNTMVMPAMERMMEFVNTAYDSNHRSIKALTNALDRVTQLQAKEISFLKSVIIKCCHLDPDKLNLAREEYFKQFDGLNKENNNENKSI